MAHLNLLVLLLRPLLPRSTRIIVRQNGAVRAAIKAAGPFSISRFFFALGYRRADVVICQTHTTANELRTTLRLRPDQAIVLPNPVDIESIRACISIRERSYAEQSKSYLLAVGRLVPEKGFDLLIESFAQVKPEFPLLRLLIAGSGPCLPALKLQCEYLGIADHVDLPGNVAQPAQYFSRALAFVLSSRQDELPNALLEAAAAGLPIVSTPASRGVSDLLHDQPGVWLAASISVDSLTHALRRALVAVGCQRRYNHPWIEPFALNPAIDAYEAVIDKALTGGKS